MIDFMRKPRYDFADFVEVIRLLRSPDGCPWDHVQTHQSIRRNFLEETYECCEALDTDDQALMQEELGDVLMQVLFHSSIEEDRGRFDINDVCDGAVKKLVFRHPNVFEAETTQTWDDMKALEKGQKTHASTLDAVARSLPSLWRAEKLIKKANKAGAPLPTPEEARAQLTEAVESGDLGRILFQTVLVSTLTEQDAEMALHDACEGFIDRFTQLEEANNIENQFK